MNFPKFEEVVAEVRGKEPFSGLDEETILGHAALVLTNRLGSSIGANLYILKLYKHRPDVAAAASNTVCASPKAISEDLGFAVGTRNYNRRMKAFEDSLSKEV
jgi:hypothetical protein